MEHYWSLDNLAIQNAYVTVGMYDGVHLGHQEILARLVSSAQAAGSPAVVITFHPHPALVLGRRTAPLYLTNPDEKAALLKSVGINAVITLQFDSELANLPARAFMSRLKEKLGLKHLEVGQGFALGHHREGDIPTLQKLGKELGYTVGVTEPISTSSGLVSSSRIRNALNEGEVRLAAEFLGRPYLVSGEVIHGDGRGRALGIPTANLDVWAEQIIPRAGVYACRATIYAGEFLAVANIGVRPTFNVEPVAPRLETMLLDFDGDLYGKQVQLAFIERLRDEQRFSSIDALLSQINQDIANARQILDPSAGVG